MCDAFSYRPGLYGSDGHQVQFFFWLIVLWVKKNLQPRSVDIKILNIETVTAAYTDQSIGIV